MKKLQFLCVLLFVFFFITSCGTIFNGSNQEINIVSDPVNAKVTIDEREFGITPITVQLERKDNHIIKLELEGYEPEIITLNRETSGWFIGNCLFGGLIGMAVDAISGGMYVLEPEEINQTLTPSEGLANWDGDTLVIKLVTHVNPGWEKIGKLTKSPID